MKRLLLSVAVSAFIALSHLQASISFDLQAEQLRTDPSTAVAAPTSTLVMLVADTAHNGFSTITGERLLNVGSFLNGDDQILLKSDIDTTTATPGVFADFQTLALSGAWSVGDPLALVWFPTYTTLSAQTLAGDSYGLYTNANPGVDGSDAWITPADGTSGYKLYFFTSAATLEHVGGSNPDSAGDASLIVAPEPSLSCLALFGFAGILLRRRR